MIESKEKVCKGTGIAKDFKSCGELSLNRNKGLCQKCYREFIFSDTDSGNEEKEKFLIKNKKKVEKEKKVQDKKTKIEARTKSYYEKQLQSLINEIVRLIDSENGCISCDHGWSTNWTRQKHAGHRLSVGSSPTLRYNLLNIHVQCSICNNWKSGNEREYDIGIKNHLGKDVLDTIMSLKSKYKSLNLSIVDLQEYIKTARKIKKDILSGIDYSRTGINNILGIYK